MQCVEADAPEESDDQNNPPEDEMEESHTYEIVETDKYTKFLYV